MKVLLSARRCSGEESGMAQSVSRPASLLDAFAIMHSAAADVHHPQLNICPD